jgi:hypothetical protein
MYFFLYSGIDADTENSGNLTQSGSSDLNQISLDSTDRTISSMTKKKDSHSKDNVVPTYPDGSINYDGTVIIKVFILL